MTKIEKILMEINALEPKEAKILFRELLKKLRRKEEALNFLAKLKGVGKGLWKEDAQEFVSKSRQDAR